MTDEERAPVVVLDKPPGATPLEAIEAFRARHAAYRGARMGYAGRLDPLAEGVLVVLVDDENKRQSRYLGLDKTYEFEALFGVATDTYDPLGLPALAPVADPSREAIARALEAFRGEIDQPVAPFSATRVKGRSLFYWARAGRLDEVAIPVRRRTVYALDVLDVGEVDAGALAADVARRVRAVRGDFRQDAIRDAWERCLARGPSRYPVARARMACSSGTFVRGVAHAAGAALGGGAIALRIARTRVGPYARDAALRVEVAAAAAAPPGRGSVVFEP